MPSFLSSELGLLKLPLNITTSGTRAALSKAEPAGRVWGPHLSALASDPTLLSSGFSEVGSPEIHCASPYGCAARDKDALCPPEDPIICASPDSSFLSSEIQNTIVFTASFPSAR